MEDARDDIHPPSQVFIPLLLGWGEHHSRRGWGPDQDQLWDAEWSVDLLNCSLLFFVSSIALTNQCLFSYLFVSVHWLICSVSHCTYKCDITEFCYIIRTIDNICVAYTCSTKCYYRHLTETGKRKLISTHLSEFEYITWPHEAKTCVNTFDDSVLKLSHQYLFDALWDRSIWYCVYCFGRMNQFLEDRTWFWVLRFTLQEICRVLTKSSTLFTLVFRVLGNWATVSGNVFKHLGKTVKTTAVSILLNPFMTSVCSTYQSTYSKCDA